VSEGLRWLQRVLTQPGLPGALKARALNAAGVLARDQGESAKARSFYEESLMLSRGLEDKLAIASAANNLAVVMVDLGDLDRAYVLFEENLAVHSALGDKRGMGIALNNLGGLAIRKKDYSTATVLIEESLLLLRELGDGKASAAVLDNLAELAVMQGDYPRAIELYAEMLQRLQALGDKSAMAIGLEGLAVVELAQDGADHTRRAVGLLSAAEALSESAGTHRPPTEQAEYEHMLAKARDILGGEQFSIAWAQGKIKDLEQALAYALQGRAQA
jgi:tetratricopeptide (TPR) repeat protein